MVLCELPRSELATLPYFKDPWPWGLKPLDVCTKIKGQLKVRDSYSAGEARAGSLTPLLPPFAVMQGHRNSSLSSAEETPNPGLLRATKQ